MRVSACEFTTISPVLCMDDGDVGDVGDVGDERSTDYYSTLTNVPINRNKMHRAGPGAMCRRHIHAYVPPLSPTSDHSHS